MNEEQNINQLPKGWKSYNLEEIIDNLSQGWSPKCYNEASTNINEWAVIKTTAVQPGYFQDNENKRLPENLSPRKQHELKQGDLLITRAGPRIRVGICCMVKRTRPNLINCDKVYRMRANSKLSIPEYIELLLNSTEYSREIELMKTGISDSGLNLTQKQFLKLKIFLPTIGIQKAIVSKIEELFSELDKGIENLGKAQLQLKTYRQSVLKWAFEGKLTNEHVDEGELPKSWKILNLKELATDISDGDHQAPPKSNSGVPFITISNVDKDNNKIDFSDTFYVNNEYYAKLKINRKPLKGDVLYTVTGSFGIPILIDFDKEFCFQRHIGLVRPLETTNQKWLYYLLQSPDVFNQAKSTATGTAQKTVALNSLRNFKVPYCKIEEQNKIVEEIESRLSVADKMEESIKQSLQQAEALRQSILKKAFEGGLI